VLGLSLLDQLEQATILGCQASADDVGFHDSSSKRAWRLGSWVLVMISTYSPDFTLSGTCCG
jgi:hypothetical protein